VNSRERVLAALLRQKPDRVPMYLWLAPHLEKRLRDERGVEDVEEYLNMDIRFVQYVAQPEDPDFTTYTENYPSDAWVDAWGVGYQMTGTYHFTQAFHPMRNFETIEEVRQYPFPEREPDIEAMKARVGAITDRGLAACAQYERGPWEKAFYLMGMEQIMLKMYTHPEMIEYLLDRISEVNARIAAGYAESGVDFIWFGDDLGAQKGPLMNPDMWRRFVKPNDIKLINAARAVRADIPIAMHSCGSVMWALDDLVEMGVDCLQSVQPEANDLAEIKTRFGEELSFWGGIGSQSTLSYGKAEEVKEAVISAINVLGKGGGYICASSHVVEPEAPLGNIDFFKETVLSYGGYG
jgi:uroporphyrinogen decarboxylase